MLHSRRGIMSALLDSRGYQSLNTVEHYSTSALSSALGPCLFTALSPAPSNCGGNPTNNPSPVLSDTHPGRHFSMEKPGAIDARVKKRAGRACTLCRSRKVRCDVVRNGPPCTNCHLDSLDCIIPRSKRHRYALEAKWTLERSL